MGKKNNIDYASLTVADIPKLNLYQRHKFEVWVKTQERKKEIRNNNAHGFGDYLAESCNVYSNGHKI